MSTSPRAPSQSLDYLGMRLWTLPLRVFPTPKCVHKLSSLLLEFVSCRQQPLPLWRQLLGVMSSLSAIVPGSRQLAHCRRASTRVNYQAKWTVYRAWCRRRGHSISRPSVPKIASFLLYLRRSLSLSYSSIASYCSMLSGVFRFVLPELSSHFVLRDLLRSFRLGSLSCSFFSQGPPV